MASQPPKPDDPMQFPVDVPIPSPIDPPPAQPSDPVIPDEGNSADDEFGRLPAVSDVLSLWLQGSEPNANRVR